MSFTAILLFAGTMMISLWAAARVRSVYAKWSDVPASSGVTGAEVAARILDRAGIRDVQILAHDEMLGDHYDPMNKRLVLSQQNYYGRSVAALGVAAHECGHAVQHQCGYGPLHLRMAAVGITQFASGLGILLPFALAGLGILSTYAAAWFMATAMGIVMLFNLVTLPVEFDASRRAKDVLSELGFVGTSEEIAGVRQTLDAAGWTYVAAFITSLAYFLMHALPLLTGGRRDE
jgi:uncharacterized protein